jgi:putative ABC transport system ATP-binding protein/lipoprotein-releasing system ATP-binding protein
MGLVLNGINKSFGTPPVHVLKNISFDIKDGEFVALTGRSGSGKSTLLYVLSSLDPPTSGGLKVDGKAFETLPSKELHQFRNLHMGFVFQFHYLLPELTCLENILMPARKTGKQLEFQKDALRLMRDFEVEHVKDKVPGKVSGGERQRVAIARALLMKPKYLFADEPTGNLDSASGEKVMKIFERVNRQHKTTVIMVTHDMGYANRAKRRIGLKDGEVEFDRKR